MTTPDIAPLCERLREALEGVTPGRWVSSGVSVEVFRGGTLFTSYRGNAKSEDAAFIALSREAVPVLLDILERQAAEIGRLQEVVDELIKLDTGPKIRLRRSGPTDIRIEALTGEDND